MQTHRILDQTPTDLATSLQRMDCQETIGFFDQMAQTNDPAAICQLFEALDRIAPAQKLSILAPVLSAGAMQVAYNGRSLIAEYLDQRGRNTALELLEAERQAVENAILEGEEPSNQPLLDLLRNEVENDLCEATLRPRGQMVYTRIEDTLASLETITQLEPLGLADLSTLNQVLQQAELQPNEMDAVLRQWKPAGVYMEELEDLLDSATDDALLQFAVLLAIHGGPTSKAVALELLAQEVRNCEQWARKRLVLELSKRLIRSGDGNVLCSRRGPAAIQAVLESFLDSDLRLQVQDLQAMTGELPVRRAAGINQVIREAIGLGPVGFRHNRPMPSAIQREFQQYHEAFAQQLADNPRQQHCYLGLSLPRNASR